MLVRPPFLKPVSKVAGLLLLVCGTEQPLSLHVQAPDGYHAGKAWQVVKDRGQAPTIGRQKLALSG